MRRRTPPPGGAAGDAAAAEDEAGGRPKGKSLRLDLKRFTRQRLLDAALECFRRSGFRTTTVEQIAEMAGTTVPTFYRHFPSKDDLILPLEAYLQGEVEETLRELDKIDVTNKDDVRKWFDVYIVMWSRVHRLCDAFWEASTLDGAYARNVYPDSISTVSVLENILGRYSGISRDRIETQLAMMVLFMDRAALMVVAEESNTKAKFICEQFSHMLWLILNSEDKGK